MRLTTRLMQIASWLLVQRAVAEGEITADQAQAEKNRVRLGVRTSNATTSPNSRSCPLACATSSASPPGSTPASSISTS